ncbi:MAG: ATP-binding protein [Muribaculaceae bacterium]|nr:ATP-binding protein [Muribaculaceae bacterium]
MLKRKIETYLSEWKRSENKKPLVIKGIRQCGKTYIVKKFAKENYPNVVYLNFILEPDKKSAFTGNLDVETIILNLSALIPGARFIAGKTCIILDEIQECKEARTALKSFMIDGRFDVIATGSLLGVKGYGRHKNNNEDASTDSVPVGYETVVEMYPLDFEEFLWANSVNTDVINTIKSCFDNECTVPDGIHKAMMELMYRYVIVGGLPEVVNCFLETKNIDLIYQTQRTLLSEYEEDMVKYADDADKPHIRECFESIPKQLAKENKKFQYSVVKKGGRASQYLGSIQWLEDAGIADRCYNTTCPQLPLSGNAIEDCFKVYTTDIGILMGMLDFGTQADILKGNLLGYKGAIYENLMADFLYKSNQKLYYFHKDSGLEIDFLVRFNGECTLLEVKSTTGKAKSMTTVLKNKNIYHVNKAIKLGQYNVGREGEVLTIPLYMGFLIKDKIANSVIPDIDLNLLSK